MSNTDFTHEELILACDHVLKHEQGSASLLQRKLSIGYNKATAMVDKLHDLGIIGPFRGSKAREILISNSTQCNMLITADFTDDVITHDDTPPVDPNDPATWERRIVILDTRELQQTMELRIVKKQVVVDEDLSRHLEVLQQKSIDMSNGEEVWIDVPFVEIEG